MSSAEQAALSYLRKRVTSVYPFQVREAVQPLTEEQIWWRPNEASNSIGNLVLHLCGSLNHYLNRNIGGITFQRDRAAEFNERRPIPKAELLAAFDDMVAKAEKTFDGITVARLSDPSPVPAMHDLLIEDLMNFATHVSTHVGQILWIAKMLSGTDLDDLWHKSHVSTGAWKPNA
jgi:hypothetical protein